MLPPGFLIWSLLHAGMDSELVSVAQEDMRVMSQVQGKTVECTSVAWIRILIFYPSRIQRSKRHRIQDSQHCENVCFLQIPGELGGSGLDASGISVQSAERPPPAAAGGGMAGGFMVGARHVTSWPRPQVPYH